MVIVKIVDNPLNTNELLFKVCNYITNSEKTFDGRYVGTRGLSVTDPYNDILYMRQVYRKNGGRIGYHLVISYPPEAPITPHDAYLLAFDISNIFFPEYQVLYSVHEDKEHVHIHMFINSTSLRTGKKLHFGFQSINTLREIITKLSLDYINI